MYSERNASARETHRTREKALSPLRVAFSCVGWFSRTLAFCSLYCPWGKMRDYSWSKNGMQKGKGSDSLYKSLWCACAPPGLLGVAYDYSRLSSFSINERRLNSHTWVFYKFKNTHLMLKMCRFLLFSGSTLFWRGPYKWTFVIKSEERLAFVYSGGALSVSGGWQAP